MRKYAMAACLFMAALNVCAQTKEKDSLRVIALQALSLTSQQHFVISADGRFYR